MWNFPQLEKNLSRPPMTKRSVYGVERKATVETSIIQSVCSECFPVNVSSSSASDCAPILSVAGSPDSKYVLSGSDDGNIRLW